MKSKEKRINVTLKRIIFFVILFFIMLCTVIFYNIYFPNNKSYAKEVNSKPEEIKISNAKEIDLEKIIDENSNNGETEEISIKTEELEYLTKYRTNKKIPKGISYVVQEGRKGEQQITIKKKYDKDKNLISEEQINSTIIKASSDKIVEIGGANYTSNYKPKVNEKVYVTSDELEVKSEPNEQSRKITILKQDDELKILEITQNWYKISCRNIQGWVKSECTIYINPHIEKNETQNTQVTAKNKQEILSGLSFDMKLNKPSGLTLEQFRKVLTDNKDTNKIFENNAEYFYYIEKQYNINGLFVVAVGIHESNWGTSKIALQKNNLFGYGAYDSNPYNGAYEFSNYSESIDLLARVFVKYYLNPKGTSIYSGEVALGTYYNGSNLSGVNKKYASDNNWANAVYTHIKYLYSKI